jgi:molybdopterin synthase catalytic subunit
MTTRAGAIHDLCALVTHAIDMSALAEQVRSDTAGAVAMFAGVVRDHHRGKKVDRLEYEAYPPMAEQEMRRIIADLRSRWALESVAMVHRTGRLEVGEISLAIAVSSAHRREALEACAYAVDCVKASVPVWKKEHGEAGTDWVIGDDSPKAVFLPTLPPLNRSARRRELA